MAREYDTFILQDPATVPEDQELELVVRELTPDNRRYKYRSFYAIAKLSKSETKYTDRLRIRLGRGQLLDECWSIELVREINKFQ
jgi:hypothetical protein